MGNKSLMKLALAGLRTQDELSQQDSGLGADCYLIPTLGPPERGPPVRQW